MSKLEEWIEYMEAGLPQSDEHLGMLLEHSITDQLVLDNLRRLRRVIKMTDPSEDCDEALRNEQFLKSFHARVMGKIKREVKNATTVKREKSASAEEHRADSLAPEVGQQISLEVYKR
ncbi:MAG: hypothetical protein ABL927_00570 [Bdellovibrionales bacterium]